MQALSTTAKIPNKKVAVALVLIGFLIPRYKYVVVWCIPYTSNRFNEIYWKSLAEQQGAQSIKLKEINNLRTVSVSFRKTTRKASSRRICRLCRDFIPRYQEVVEEADTSLHLVLSPRPGLEGGVSNSRCLKINFLRTLAGV